MTDPFGNPLDLTSTAMKILEQDRLTRETLKSLGGPDQATLALQAVEHGRAVDRFVQGFGGAEGLRHHMARASEAQRAFTEAFPPERLSQLQNDFARHVILRADAGRELAALAQTMGSMPNVFARLQSIPDVATLVHQGIAGRNADLQAAIRAGSRLDVAWASVAMPASSIGALTELRIFTGRIRSAWPAADDRVVEIDQQFGRYDEAFADAETAATEDEREGVYTEGGRNPALVAFPVRAYPSVLVAAGWVQDFLPPPAPLLATGVACEVSLHDPADGATITAVEGHLRHHVNTALTTRFGSEWPRTYVAAEKVADWGYRQQASTAKGNPAFALIYYADFQDLLDIIGRKDLWRNVFGGVFGSKPLFQATMTRLHAIRLELAHARPLTNTARLRLEVEANTVFAALGVLRN